MSRFSGPQRKGAGRAAKETRKLEAEERNSRTPTERTARYRRDTATYQFLAAVFGGAR